MLSLFVMSAVTGLLVWRQPRSAFTWTFATLAMTQAINALTTQYAIHGLNVAPDSLPLADAAARFQLVSGVPTIMAAVAAVLLFPDGRLRSIRWSVPVILALVLQVSEALANLANPYPLIIGYAGRQGVPVNSLSEWWPIGQAMAWVGRDTLWEGSALFWGNNVLVVLVGLGVVLRMRAASGESRLQLRWFGLAVAFACTAFLLSRADRIAAFLLSQNLPPFREAALATLHPFALWADQGFSTALGLLVPLSIGVAITRYRLYDIDLVISRTIIYGGLAAFVTLCYGITVAGVGSIVGQTAGLGPLVTVIAIALIALLLEPVRARLSSLANVAIYGKRASPYEILSDFARSVGRAESADVLLPRMADLVRDGAGATLVEVWVRVGERLQLAAASPTSSSSRETLPGTKELAARAGPTGTVVPVFHDAEQLGALVVVKQRGDELNPAQDRLLNDLASQAGLVFSRFRLVEELRGSRARIVAAQDVERRRIERDLHDGAQQRFVNAMLSLGMAQAADGNAAHAGDLLRQASREMQAGLSELRDLARGLHPPLLTESGLHAAVASLADRSPIETSVVGVPDRRYAEPVEVTAYYVVAEALANAAKHSHASLIKIRIDEDAGRLRVEVSDDGVGGVDARRGSGLIGLQDRTAAIGGSLQVESPSGHGTVVRAELPCG
jgi:signal transduction histidine kinase